MIVAVLYEPGAVWEMRLSSDEKTCELWCRNVITGEESSKTFAWHKCENVPMGHPIANFTSPEAFRIADELLAKLHVLIFDERAN